MGTDIIVSVLIVSYGTRDLLRQCLRVAQGELQNLHGEIIVVDNASLDGSSEMVQQEFPAVKLIQNSTNRGFAGANNQGLAKASGRYICLLNPDVLLSPGALSRMIEFLDAHRHAGVAGPKLVLPSGIPQMGAAGYQIELRTIFNHFFFFSRLFPGWRMFRGYSLYQDCVCSPYLRVDWVSGACLTVRQEVVQDVGLLDDSFFMYVEDLEWCDRIRRAGWEIYYLRDVEVIHHKGASSKVLDEQPDPSWLLSLDKYCRIRHGLGKTLLIHGIAASGFVLRLGVYYIWGLLVRDVSSRRRGRAMKTYLATSLQLLVRALLLPLECTGNSR